MTKLLQVAKVAAHKISMGKMTLTISGECAILRDSSGSRFTYSTA